MVAGMMSKMGVFMGPPSSFAIPIRTSPGDTPEIIEKNAKKVAIQNPKGFFENRNLMRVNRKLLSTYGPHTLFRDMAALKHCLDSAMTLMSADYTEDVISGFKDPRLCLTLPMWVAAIGDRPVKVIKIYRNPDEIAASLHQRNNMPQPLARCINHYYEETFENHRQQLDGSVNVLRMTFEAVHDRPLGHAKLLANFLGHNPTSKQIVAAAQHVDKRLKRSKPDSYIEGNWWEIVN